MLKRILVGLGGTEYIVSTIVALAMTQAADVTGVSIINEGRLGNTNEQVIDRVQCSVLTFTPYGFISPVTLPEVSKADSSGGSNCRNTNVPGIVSNGNDSQ